MINDFIDRDAFWADGNYGMKRITERNKAEAEAERLKRVNKWEEEEKERQRLAAALWKNEFHPGIACCSSCYGEYADGYAGGGVMMDGYCCCRDKDISKVEYPLDSPHYRPEHPPVNGKVPEVFHKWGPNTQERYLKRYKEELNG